MIKVTASSDGVDFTTLDFKPITFEKHELTPRCFGHDYDSWDEYYEACPDQKPVYCGCCRQRI